MTSIIAPSLLAADIGNLRSEIASIVSAKADWLHLDIMDGSFVPPITFGENVVALCRRECQLVLDVHLMIEHPEQHLMRFRDAGAHRLTVHVETSPQLHRTLGEIRSLGMLSGVALNPGTPVEQIYPVLPICDLVLVMTVNPGWGGQPFISESIGQIRKLASEIKRQGLATLIEVDGGIVPSSAKDCRAAGATVFVAGTSVFGTTDRAMAIAALRS